MLYLFCESNLVKKITLKQFARFFFTVHDYVPKGLRRYLMD